MLNLPVGERTEDETLNILTDGIIPRFQLGSPDWTQNLVVLQNQDAIQFPDISFNFGEPTSVGAIELVMFNCPQMNITVQYLTLSGGVSRSELQDEFLNRMGDLPESCVNYIHVCLSLPSDNREFPVLLLLFEHPSPGDDSQVYIAETIFHPADSVSCPSELRVRVTGLYNIAHAENNTVLCNQWHKSAFQLQLGIRGQGIT